ncbi:MAG: hormogonium polysaccharide biosynthesis protein HpsA, partial [Spirulinaceae cyanobacterium]
MPRRKKKVNFLKKLFKQTANWVARRLRLTTPRSRSSSRAGFVLPTVVMVMLVVALLTTTIMIRSFDRSKNASNYRVNQVVLNSALPAIDRAKAKMEKVFASPTTRGTASEIIINTEFRKSKFTFKDETRLQIAYDADGGGSIEGGIGKAAVNLKEDETTINAWRFPVDTDNNGVFDSFTLYSLVFRTPLFDTTSTDGDYVRERTPIEARTAPMDDGDVGGFCAAALGTSASLTGSSDWFDIGGDLKKSFFVYVATVPITDVAELGLSATDFEDYRGTPSYSVLEYQQDRVEIPPANNAILYTDDLDVVSGTPLRINGRIFTNSNMLVTELNSSPAAPIEFYQVSSEDSCFYKPENGKIVIGGNLGYGRIGAASPPANNIKADLYKKNNVTQKNDALSPTNKSVTQASDLLAYNTEAYENRISDLVDIGLTKAPDPEDVKDKQQEEEENGLTPAEARRKAMDVYFRNRTRRVPFAEVPAGAVDPVTIDVVGTGDDMRPLDQLMFPFNPGDGKTGTGFSTLALNTNGTKLYPAATNPDNVRSDREERVGDRVLVGHGLPALWYDNNAFVGEKEKQPISGITWDDSGQRYRQTRSELVKELDATERGGFWEQAAAEHFQKPEDGIGGLRVVTGAGIYLPGNGTAGIGGASNVVWPDTMPQPAFNSSTYPLLGTTTTPNTGKVFDATVAMDSSSSTRPYLHMRATAVYHHNQGVNVTVGGVTKQVARDPIACVATFYDPTTKETARNRLADFGGASLVSDADFDFGDGTTAFDDVSGFAARRPVVDPPNPILTLGSIPTRATLVGDTDPNNDPNSLNGITYGPPTGSYSTELDYQAGLFYPNGRRVNPLLNQAKTKGYASATLTLQEKAAVDTATCALDILNGSLTPTTSPSGFGVPHGTIQEVSFLDARQIKSIEKDINTNATNGYQPDDPSGSGVSKDFDPATGVT